MRSWIESISLNWLRHLHIAIGVLWVLYFVALAYGGRGPVEEVLNIAIVVVVYLLGYLGLRQPEIFTRRSRTLPAETGSAASRPKYEKSALDAESAKVLFEELQKVMVEDQPYLDRKLTLSQLAEHLGLTPNYLSQVINQQAESNFFEFINGFRVEAAKKMLSDPSEARKSVLSVALESGFNSKSSFYSAFKYHTGVTPTQYRQSGMS